MGDFGKINVAKGFKKLPKVQQIAQSGHTGLEPKDQLQNRDLSVTCVAFNSASKFLSGKGDPIVQN